MLKMDKHYIDEAKRIRRKYIENIVHITNNEEKISSMVNEMESISSEMNDSESNDEEYYRELLIEIDSKVNKIKKDILPHFEVIQKLNDEQKILYNNIKDKYDKLSNDEIVNILMPHIIELDKTLKEQYQGVFEKIKNK
jgi:hypothetical protein